MAAGHGHLQVAHADYYLPDGRLFLSDASFRVGADSTMALAGPDGAGKPVAGLRHSFAQILDFAPPDRHQERLTAARCSFLISNVLSIFLRDQSQLIPGSLAFEVRPGRPVTLPPLLLPAARLAHDPPCSA